MKKMLVLLFVFLAVNISIAYAEDVDIDIKCPATVKVGSPLNVTVVAYNDSGWNASIKRLFKGVMGNAGAH